MTTKLAADQYESKVVNVKDFGAVGDGVTDDTVAINSAFEYARSLTATNQGHKIYFPRGTYLISSTIDTYMPIATGCVIEGDGYNVTVLLWNGGSGAMLSNEQATNDRFQYGLFIRDMTLNNASPRSLGSVGIHVEMLQNKAKIERVCILQFELGLFVGLHAEMLSVENCFIAYNQVGAYGQGDQTDVLTFRSTTFSYNELRALKLSSPRSIVTDCHFNEGQISDLSSYRDIQLGYSAIRTQDIGKSSYATADKGNDGSRTRFLNNSFEGIGTKAAVLFEDFDSRVGIPGGNITFENNKAALYDRPAFLEVINPYFNVKFEGTQISATSEDTCLINDNNTVTGSYVINEPYISKVWASTEQFLRNGINKEYFDSLYQYGCSLQHSGDWLVDRTTGITLVDMDIDGSGTMEVSYDEATFVGTPSVRFYNNNCPAGYVYFMLPFRKLNGSLFLEFEVKTGGGTTLHYSKGHQISEDSKYYVFGFNNPTVQSISLRVYPKPYSNDVSSFFMDLPLVKHFNNEMESFALVDTSANKLFTNRLGQVFELIPKIPHTDILSIADKATGQWFFSQPKASIMGAAAVLGDTTITVANASTVYSIGEYLHFKPQTVANVSRVHSGTVTTGNKISNIVGDTVTLATGIPFNVDNGGSVIGCKVYQQAASTKL